MRSLSGNTFKTVLDEIGKDALASLQSAYHQGYVRKKFNQRAATAFFSNTPESAGPANAGAPRRTEYEEHASSGHTPRQPLRHDPAPVTLPTALVELKENLKKNPPARALRILRRRFAMDRHPDRFHAFDREQATREMAIANDLIDRALRNSARGGR